MRRTPSTPSCARAAASSATTRTCPPSSTPSAGSARRRAARRGPRRWRRGSRRRSWRSAAAGAPDVSVAASLGRLAWAAWPTSSPTPTCSSTPRPSGTGYGREPACRVDLHRPDLAVLDLVYRPSPTRLVRDARAAGARARGRRRRPARPGLAVASSSGSDRPAPVEAMRAALEAELGGTLDA